jgi:hypothetical protein
LMFRLNHGLVRLHWKGISLPRQVALYTQGCGT